MSAARAFLWLLPAGRRDWVEALWAESAALPPGRERARWRAGAARIVAADVLRGWRSPGRLAFLAAAVLAAAGCWPASQAGEATDVDRADAVATIVLLTVLAFLGRRILGPVRGNWVPRAIRLCGFGAILALLPARAAAQRYLYGLGASDPGLRRYVAVSHLPTGAGHWLVECLFVVALSLCAVAVLLATSGRSRLTGSALGLSVGLGLTFGACLYLSAPLGPRSPALDPWLPGPWLSAIVVADWALLFAGPALVALLVGSRFTGPDAHDGLSLPERRITRSVVAGLLFSATAALSATLAAAATITASLWSPATADLLYGGTALTGVPATLRDANATGSESAYLLICLGVLLAGFIVSAIASAVAVGLTDGQQFPPAASGGSGGGRGRPPRGPAPLVPRAPQGYGTAGASDKQSVPAG